MFSRRRKKRKRSFSLAQKKRSAWREERVRTLKAQTKRALGLIFLLTVVILTFLSFFGAAGKPGEWWLHLLRRLFGLGAYVLPVLLLFWVLARFDPALFPPRPVRLLGGILLLAALMGILHLMYPAEAALSVIDEERGGGYVGFLISFPLRKLLSVQAAWVILLATLFASLMMLFDTSPAEILAWWRKQRKARRPVVLPKPEQPPPPEPVLHRPRLPLFSTRAIGGKEKVGEVGSPPRPLREEVIQKPEPDRTYTPPSPELLISSSGKPEAGDIRAKQEIIQRTLAHFGIPVEMGEVKVGPTITQFTLKPSSGVKLAKITALTNDLAMALAAHPIRIEAPIPGKSLVGIEVPNRVVSLVRLRDIITAPVFTSAEAPLSFGLGKDVAGEVIVDDLGRMPHLLIAGATGSGKSVMINTLIIALLYRNSPRFLRFILIDPKRVELQSYNGLPHLLTPVVVEPEQTIHALKWIVGEMDRRYRLLSEAGARNIESYNARERREELLPYIVVIIDEMADLMARYASEIEGAVVRLAQMARAVGVHLVLATQRPSVDILTGLIKANIPSRIAFRVASVVDSRTILDTAGAEKLMGNGDMLYLSGEAAKPRRIQGAFVSEREVKRVVDFLKKREKPEYREDVTAPQPSSLALGENLREEIDDELYEEAKRVVIETGRASASLLQRRLRIGYARAARIIDLLEERGVVGPADGARPREVLVPHKRTGRGGYISNEGEEQESPETQTRSWDL
jgi:S-DNA-T family DNA segregation ATPase FtsK/SpoIIIE